MITRILFIILLVLPQLIEAQSFWDNTSLMLGLAVSEQDRRLFQSGNQDGIINAEEQKVDWELNLSLQKVVLDSKFLRFRIGLGLNRFTNTFSRPFDYRSINGDVYLRSLRIHKYTTDKLIIPISVTIYPLGKESVFLEFYSIPSLSFRRQANQFVKWEFEPNSVALYPGIGVNISSRLRLGVYYRWKYIYRLDEVIFNELLFKNNNNPFLNKKYDTFNPTQIWMTVSYELKGN